MTRYVFLDKDWKPTTAEAARLVKVFHDDGSITFGVAAPKPDPLTNALQKLAVNVSPGRRLGVPDPVTEKKEAGGWASQIRAALRKLAANSFPGHRGELGHRGGSLGRDEAAGSPTVKTRDRDEYALDAVFAKGGVTMKSTGLPNEPTKGYCVSEHPELGAVIENARGQKRKVLKKQIRAFVRSNSALLSQGESYLGLWLNGDNGALYIDVASVKDDLEMAKQAGRDHDQIAIWDIENGVEIATGGSGKKGADYSP